MIFDIIKKLFVACADKNEIYYINGAETLPAPLSPEEEADIISRLQNEPELRSVLVEHNLRLVVYIAKKFENTGCGIEDLISIGTIGLIKAVSSFNYDRNIRFATYAARCIDNEILMFFRSLKKTTMDDYLDDPIDVDKDGNSMSLMDIITVDDCMVDKIDMKIKSGSLYEFVEKCLDKREAEIIRARYGLYGSKPLTQREVADKLNISRSYVSRIEKRALEKLHDKYQNSKLL